MGPSIKEGPNGSEKPNAPPPIVTCLLKFTCNDRCGNGCAGEFERYKPPPCRNFIDGGDEWGARAFRDHVQKREAEEKAPKNGKGFWHEVKSFF